MDKFYVPEAQLKQNYSYYEKQYVGDFICLDTYQELLDCIFDCFSEYSHPECDFIYDEYIREMIRKADPEVIAQIIQENQITEEEIEDVTDELLNEIDYFCIDDFRMYFIDRLTEEDYQTICEEYRRIDNIDYIAFDVDLEIHFFKSLYTYKKEARLLNNYSLLEQRLLFLKYIDVPKRIDEIIDALIEQESDPDYKIELADIYDPQRFNYEEQYRLVDTEAIMWLLENYTQYNISKNTGVPQPTLSKIVNGKRELQNVTIDIGAKLTTYAYQLKEREDLN